MIRTLLWLVAIGCIVVLGATVPLGKRTLFGHVGAIWKTKEVADMRDGISDKAGPTVERMKRGVEAGLDEARKDEAPVPDAALADAATPKPEPKSKAEPKPTPKPTPKAEPTPKPKPKAKPATR